MAAPVSGSGPKHVTIPNFRVLLRSHRAGRAGACMRSKRSSRRLGQPVVSASARGRSNQRKGMYHKRKQGKRLGELTGFTFERNLEQRREADHLGDLLCSDDRWPFVIENKYRCQGNSIPAGAWEQACRTAFKSDRWPASSGRMAAQRRAVAFL